MIEPLYQRFLSSSGVGTDTRKPLAGKIFFALKGENFNGNLYAEKALEHGASLAVVDEPVAVRDSRVLQVEDALKTLQQLANHHRIRLGTYMIGITGSNGKTTNKELLNLVLSQQYECYCTKGNHNNHIGVPLSLLELNDQHEIAIIEMGANRPGDIEELCMIANPDDGFITNIGLAHLEGLGSKDGIAKEKGELFQHVKRKGGEIFVNSSEQEVVELAGHYPKTIFIGERTSDHYTFHCEQAIPEVEFRGHLHSVKSHLYGEHNYENLKMAAGIGLEMKVSPEQVKTALESYKPANNRSQIEIIRGVTIFMDAYNANPSSMSASVHSFASWNHPRKHLVLGEMLELGENSEALHLELLTLVDSYEWNSVFLLGQCFVEAAKEFPHMLVFNDVSEANEVISAKVGSGDAVLLKGSRGVKLETLDIAKQPK